MLTHIHSHKHAKIYTCTNTHTDILKLISAIKHEVQKCYTSENKLIQLPLFFFRTMFFQLLINFYWFGTSSCCVLFYKSITFWESLKCVIRIYELKFKIVLYIFCCIFLSVVQDFWNIKWFLLLIIFFLYLFQSIEKIYE